MEAYDVLPGTSYRLLSLLGRGQAEVHLAHDLALGTRCIVKILTDTSAMAVERFQFEARTQAQCQHPHIARVLSFGTSNGRPYLVSEALEGRTLQERLEHAEVSLQDALRIAVHVLEGVGAAHKKNLMHRDLKPGNIFLAEVGGGDFVAKILDFGFAKRTPYADEHSDRAPSTDPRYFVGTLGYVAPESLMEGVQGDARSDLFSVGVVLYEMLSGHRPFTGHSAREVMSATVADDPRPPLAHREINPDVTLVVPALEQIVSKALAKHPDDRFQTAEEFLSELSNIQRWFQSRTSFEVGQMCANWCISGPLAKTEVGYVYRARHAQMRDWQVAIRTIVPPRPRDYDRVRRRLNHQAAILRQLRHPNLVRVHDVGVTDDRLWLAVDRLDTGQSLREILDTFSSSGQTLAPQDALRWGADIAAALGEAHRSHVLHGAIDPDQIVITDESIAVLQSLGVARLLDDGSSEGYVLGPTAYMAPEQPARLCVQSDIFSLGVVLYQLLSGTLPFGEHDSNEGFLKAVRSRSPTRLTDPVLWGLLEPALRKESEYRYTSMGEFEQVLRARLAELVTAENRKQAKALADKVTLRVEVARAEQTRREQARARPALTLHSEKPTIFFEGVANDEQLRLINRDTVGLRRAVHGPTQVIRSKSPELRAPEGATLTSLGATHPRRPTLWHWFGSLTLLTTTTAATATVVALVFPLFLPPDSQVPANLEAVRPAVQLPAPMPQPTPTAPEILALAPFGVPAPPRLDDNEKKRSDMPVAKAAVPPTGEPKLTRSWRTVKPAPSSVEPTELWIERKPNGLWVERPPKEKSTKSDYRMELLF